MPRTTQKSQPEINLALLKTLSKSQDLGLKLEFELTHLDYIADKVSDFWGLDTEITGQDLLETIYYDFAELNIENAFDVIILATSILSFEKVLTSYPKELWENKLVVDVLSVKL